MMSLGRKLYIQTAKEWKHSNAAYWGKPWESLPEWRQHLWELMAEELMAE